MKKVIFTFSLFVCQALHALSLAEQFARVGYAEICDTQHGAATFEALYILFDELIEFLQKNPVWAQKLYSAKERFIRSKERSYYATDFFGFYDEAEREGRHQIAFYYAAHFHEFVCAHYPEFSAAPAIIRFFEACNEIQKSYGTFFVEAATELGVATIFESHGGTPPILFKVVKYFPSYRATKPHYDGSAFSLFLDSTDNESLLLSPYKLSSTADDFFVPSRKISRSYHQNSIVLIPGSLLADYGIYPTPHIVMESGEIRYAAIAFTMRPHYTPPKNENHKLKGVYAGCWECHIEPDWLLVYEIYPKELVLVRMGSHSDLF